MEIHIAEIAEMVINSTMYQDPVFISIDTEGDPAREFGISILDTRDLKHILFTSEVQSGSLISTFNYQLQRHEKAEFKSPFQFGSSRMIRAGSVHSLLQKIFRTGHPDPSRQEPRNTILVGHSVDGDIASLKKVTERTWSIHGFPHVLVFDTQLLQRAMFGGPPQKRLEKLLIKLRIPYKFLHNGGNDSNLTLRAIQALALRDCPFDKYCSLEMWKRKKIIRALAHMPTPAEINHLEPIPFNPLESLDLSHSFQVDSDPPDLLPGYEYKLVDWMRMATSDGL